MMAPTHMLVGAAVAVPIILLAPEFSLVAVIAGLFGGLLPDLDMYYGHRRTLHFPVYYTIGTGVLVPVAVLVPTHLTMGVLVAGFAAALHSIMDIFGGGLELYPWRNTSDRAVYSHYHRRWIRPRRWIRYDGSLEDLCITVVFASVLLVTIDGVLFGVILTITGTGAVYVGLRKTLPRIAECLVQRLPIGVSTYLPARYLADH